ncbi:MAG: RNA polymerase sigma factor [Desulfobacteraceae bacterium]|nr:RNA polymerase sigma factor [Desulfobacteraceae bacterium]
MRNPLYNDAAGTGDPDRVLAAAARAGDKSALERLIVGHQPWIYNLAFRMVMDHDDAGDITQEILIKIITNLALYDPQKGAFRTWVYRIVVNHVLNMKKRKFEVRIHDFDAYAAAIENFPDDSAYAHPDAVLLAEEVKTGCMLGMLLCLKRPERVAFLLGAVFGVQDAVGAGIMAVSRENFRQMLSRARKKVRQYMHATCGVVNPDNRCRCAHKVKAFLDLGMLDAKRLRYHRPSAPTVKAMIGARLTDFQETYYAPFLANFRAQPFYDAPDVTAWLRKLLETDAFKEIFNLDDDDR